MDRQDKMQISAITNRIAQGQRIERVTVEGIELLISVTTARCSDGVMRDMVDPFVAVIEDGQTMTLALSRMRVSEHALQDAILAALMPNRDSGA